MGGDDTDECQEYIELPAMKVKTLTTDDKAVRKSGIPRSTYYYAKKKVREGQSYTPQKHNRKKFKAI